jgi:hypothetical protein
MQSLGDLSQVGRYTKGEMPRIETVSFAYMWSAHQDLGPGIGHWHPHMMVFTPYYENYMLGGNKFGGTLPFVSDDAGTPFAVTVIPVDDGLARKFGEANSVAPTAIPSFF